MSSGENAPAPAAKLQSTSPAISTERKLIGHVSVMQQLQHKPTTSTALYTAARVFKKKTAQKIQRQRKKCTDNVIFDVGGGTVFGALVADAEEKTLPAHCLRRSSATQRGRACRREGFAGFCDQS
ncbi:hypothetical protein SLA2020_093570 [Shorea laevis]